jgi:hypothetical protein
MKNEAQHKAEQPHGVGKVHGLPSPGKLAALPADLLFQFVQQHGIVLADGVNQR